MKRAKSDVWVCANCRSVNKPRAKQCYQCRTPQDLAAVDPLAISSTTLGQVRAVELPPFHSSIAFAFVASVFILAFVALEVVRTLIASALLTRTVDASQPVPLDEEGVRALGIVMVGVGILALVSWSLWLSRAVRAMPALGLGYPAATGLTAFIENFIPGLNLLRVPAILRDIVHRLEPRSGRVDALMFAAWIGLISGVVIPRAGSILLIGAETREQLVRNMIVIASVSIGVVVAGALFLVALIWWIEIRIIRRRRAQLAESAPRSAATATATHPTQAVPSSPFAPRPVAAPMAPPTAPMQAPFMAPIRSDTTPAPSVLMDAGAGRSPVASGGPRLSITVEANGTIAAELDGVVEAVTLDDLRVAGPALAKAGGSAIVTANGTGADALLTARTITSSLRDNAVPTTFEDKGELHP